MTTIHIGRLIEKTFHNQGRTVTWFAAKLCCTRPNIYKIFHKENIDAHMLWNISCLLEHDFFKDLSDAMQKREAETGANEKDEIASESLAVRETVRDASITPSHLTNTSTDETE